MRAASMRAALAAARNGRCGMFSLLRYLRLGLPP
jgi:hypothetical protein